MDTLFNYVRNELQPEAFCQSIGACPAVSDLTDSEVEEAPERSQNPELQYFINTFPAGGVRPLVKLQPAVRESFPKTVECDVCQKIIAAILDELKDNTTEAAIEKALENVCSLFPSSERQECRNFIDEYTDELIKILTTTTDPKEACTLLNLCSAHDKPIPTKYNPVECVICKRVVAFIVSELKDRRTEQEIIHVLDRVCVLLPRKEQDQCQTFIDDYTDELIHILTEEGNPNLVCALLNACIPHKLRPYVEQASSRSERIRWTEIEPAEPVAENNKIDELEVESVESVTQATVAHSTFCYECEVVMHFLQNQMYNFKTEEEIEKFLEDEICTRLKTVVQRETCDSFIRTYGKSLIQIIAQKILDPTTVCERELRICPNTSQVIHQPNSPNTQFEMMSSQTPKCEICKTLVNELDGLLENGNFDKELSTFIERVCNFETSEKRQEVN